MVAAVGVVEAASRTSLGEETNPIREPNIQISPKVNGRGVACISAGVGVHFSVPHPPVAHGKTFTPLKNETVTSSAPLTSI